MAELMNRFSVAFSSTLDLSEPELRALDAMTKYGDDSFLDWFYVKLGRVYMEPHEEGLKSLFKSIRGTVTPALKSIDDARAILKKQAKG